MNKRLQQLIDKGMIPNKGGVFIDSYNQSVNEEIAGTITTRIDASNMSYVTEPKIIERDTPMKGNYTEPRICTMVGRDSNNPSSRARSDHYEQFLEKGDDVSNTLTSVQKDNLVAEPNECTAKTLCLNSKVDGKQPSLEHRIYDAEGVSTAMTTGFLPNIKESTSYRIRKLTPRECFRLMGVTETDIDKIQRSGVSQSQQYKMAGNSIVVDVLEHIFRKMFVDTNQESQQLSLF